VDLLSNDVPLPNIASNWGFQWLGCVGDCKFVVVHSYEICFPNDN